MQRETCRLQPGTPRRTVHEPRATLLSHFPARPPVARGRGRGLGAPCAAAGPGRKGVVAWPPPPCPGALSWGQLRPLGRRSLPHPILSTPGRHAGGAQPALPRLSAPASTHRAPPPGERPSELAGPPLLPSPPRSPPPSSPSLWSSRPSPASPRERLCPLLHPQTLCPGWVSRGLRHPEQQNLRVRWGDENYRL